MRSDSACRQDQVESPKGAYSIARFELLEHEAGCRILFDHAGFPRGEAESLRSGWHEHYWEPLQKLLS